MTPLQTRIFVPFANPYTNQLWVETLVGRVIAPLVKAHKISHFWFSRYGEDKNGSQGDTDLTKIPVSFRHPQADFYRSVRFRLWLPNTVDQPTFEKDLFAHVGSASCAIADLRHYADLDDLACERFCGGTYSESRRAERRDLLRNFLSSTAHLFVQMLEGPNSAGEFHLEENKDKGNNPDGATFQSVHHLFCNMTDVPLTVFVRNPVLGTHIYPNDQSNSALAVKVRF